MWYCVRLVFDYPPGAVCGIVCGKLLIILQVRYVLLCAVSY